MIFSHPSDFQKHCAKDLFSVAALEILVSTQTESAFIIASCIGQP
jgi:hypothetical protein